MARASPSPSSPSGRPGRSSWTLGRAASRTPKTCTSRRSCGPGDITRRSPRRCVWCGRRPSASGGGVCWRWRSIRTGASVMRWTPCTAPARCWSTSSGLDPGPDLASLEQAILRQDPSLAVHGRAAPSPVPTVPTSGSSPTTSATQGPTSGGRRTPPPASTGSTPPESVAIVGPSGCGKSSLARAGVAAALERDGRRVRVMVPGAPSVDVLSGTVAGRGRSVLVVDQCEEALAPEVSRAERAAFFAALADFAATGPLILTLRADRLGDISRYPAFAHLVECGLCLLGPMGSDDAPARDRGPGRAGRAAPRAGPGRPPGPRGRASARRPAPALARDASDVDPARREHPDRGRVPRHGRDEGGGVPVGREPSSGG